MNSIRRRLSYANIVATLALLFAMSGGALAASHYLITSTKQISPKVLKKLKGNAGPKGATGAAGPAGPAGAAGAAGANGTAIAYGTVVVNGTGNPAFTVNSNFTGGVTSPTAGEYCIPIPSGATGINPVISPVGGSFEVAQYSPQQCGSSSYEIGSSATLTTGQGFTIVVP